MARYRTELEDLRLCHVNCQSLFAHLDEFRLFFADAGYHIICISESWLKPSISDSIVDLKGYQLFRCDRVGKVGEESRSLSPIS